jgi:NAD-dependent deacetylase
LELQIRKTAQLLNSAERIAVLSGAGLSKASGIPTYRDKGGLWMQEGTARFSSARELERDPDGFRKFWSDRRREISRANPNDGHLALAHLQRRKPGVTLITQNVDGLLTKAGASDVLEIHGNLLRERCLSCSALFEVSSVEEDGDLTRCPACNATNLRPDVVMFGEYIDRNIGAKADYLSKTSQAFLLVGTSAVVHPAAGWAEKALHRGAKLIVVNLEPTPLDDEAIAVIRGRAEEVLPLIMAAMSSAD